MARQPDKHDSRSRWLPKFPNPIHAIRDRLTIRRLTKEIRTLEKSLGINLAGKKPSKVSFTDEEGVEYTDRNAYEARKIFLQRTKVAYTNHKLAAAAVKNIITTKIGAKNLPENVILAIAKAIVDNIDKGRFKGTSKIASFNITLALNDTNFSVSIAKDGRTIHEKNGRFTSKEFSLLVDYTTSAAEFMRIRRHYQKQLE